uniref:Uncharacterized protein n=1 Tax=Anguilla anguilla TaxID=7936 RepID=A0A0E9TKZ3_ANGAN
MVPVFCENQNGGTKSKSGTREAKLLLIIASER